MVIKSWAYPKTKQTDTAVYFFYRKSKISKSTGLNQEQVLRKVLMDAPLLERPTADYIKMSRQIAALGNNLNQLAHIANASGKVSNTDLLTAKQIMEQIWRYIKGGGVQ